MEAFGTYQQVALYDMQQGLTSYRCKSLSPSPTRPLSSLVGSGLELPAACGKNFYCLHAILLEDVREPSELKDTGRIPGSINIPVKTAPDGFFLPDEDFEDRFGFVRPDRDTEVIFYCRSGVRSRAAAGLAKEAGWTKVGEYPGSWLDWSGKGGKVER